MVKRIFPVIKINNKSDEEVGNLIFTYENCKYPGGVKRVKGHDVKSVDIPNKHIDFTTELLMVHRDKKGNKQTYMIEKEFNNEFDKEINLNIFAISERGEIDFSIEK